MTEALTHQLREAVRTIQALRARNTALQADRNPPIAVVGMACRFAGADDPAALWRVLAEGIDTVRPTPPDRWDNAAWFSADPDSPGRIAFQEAAFLDDVDGFDHALFGIAAREAAGMDPQHRLLLELAWRALEDAAIRPDGLAGSATGVFLGMNGGDHMVATLSAPDRLGTHALAGAVGSIGAGRIAYAFGLNGPAMVVDTACSSSLVAVHLAVQALRRGECGMALAGGVHLMLAPNVSVALSRARMMAPDGRCKAFDEAADGFGQGEGGGMVVLKCLSDAVAAGDRVLAVIAGSALNQDGRSAGITAPNQQAQEAVLRAALADAGLAPDAVDAIEAHGTGTALGDPLELHGLAAVFRPRTRPLPVGSVKTNIGHTAAAAGIAGLIKAVLMLRHQAVPPNPHYRRLNPHVSLGDMPVEVPTVLCPSPLGCVGVSSFGFSGTNAHVVLRQAPATPEASSSGTTGLLLSARTRDALTVLIAQYSSWLGLQSAWPGAQSSSPGSQSTWPGSQSSWPGSQSSWPGSQSSWPGLTRPPQLDLCGTGSPRTVLDGVAGSSPAMTIAIPAMTNPSPAMTNASPATAPTFADACHTAWRGRARLAWWVWVTDPDALATAEPRSGPLPDLPTPPAANIVDLPLYPFERHHFPRIAQPRTGDAALYPGRLLDTPSADRLLECVLDLAAQPWLADHRVQGRVIVPGAVMIALLLAIAPTPDALADIAFVEPVVLDDGPVRLVAIGRPDGSLNVASRAGAGWLTHATARAAVSQPPATIGTQDHPPTHTREDWIAHLAALGITIGPAFQGIESIATGPTSVATVVDGDKVGGPFHPALLDAVLQVAGGTLPAEPVLPVGIGRLTLHAPLTGTLRVVAQRAGDAIDLTVTSAGRPVASIAGLAVRRLADSLPPTIAALSWQPAAADSQPARPIVFEVAPGGANLPEALALIRRHLADPAPLAFVTRGATPPVGDPAAAIFAGIASALAEERPELRIRCIDMAPGTPAAHLAAELACDSPDPVVALRPDGRFVPRLAPLAPSSRRIKLRGTTLITGGMGGVGRHAATWALDRGADAVLLVGRSAQASPPGTRTLALDIAAPDAAARLREALTGMPPLRTAIHAAGILRDGLIEDLTQADFTASLAPKLQGAHTLHDLTAGLELDHFLLFGSVASLIGAAGQANYAASNAALDAFAQWRRRQGLPATSIAWGRWAGTGMAAGLTRAQTARVTARGIAGMSPGRALAALDAAVLSGEAVVMIAALDLPRLAEAAPPVFAALLPASVPESGPVPAQVAAIVGQILGQAVEFGRPLIACGLDSLMAMDLRNRLNRRFGIALGLADLMGGADVAELAQAVERARATDDEMEEETL